MIKKRKFTVFISLGLLVFLVFLAAGCGKSNNAPSSSQNAAVSANNSNSTNKDGQTDTDQDGLPDTVEKTVGTNPYNADTDGDGQLDKVDKDPVFTKNMINESSTAPLPLKLIDARVEDNVNAADHLEITVANTGKTELKDFDLYYTVTDTVSKAQEGYYQALTGLNIQPGAQVTLHFDNKKGNNHFPGNLCGLYGTSKNALNFDIQLYAKGFAPLPVSAKKAKGTAEVAD